MVSEPEGGGSCCGRCSLLLLTHLLLYNFQTRTSRSGFSEVIKGLIQLDMQLSIAIFQPFKCHSGYLQLAVALVAKTAIDVIFR